MYEKIDSHGREVMEHFLRFENAHGLLRISFQGVVSDSASEQLRATLEQVLQDDYEDIIWDCSSMEHMGERSFAVLCSFVTRSLMEHVRPVFIDPRMLVLPYFHNVGLAIRMEFVENEERAFEYYLQGIKINYNKLFCKLLLEERLLTPDELKECLLEYNKLKRSIPFGRLLINKGYLTHSQLVRVIGRQKSYLGEILVDNGIVTAAQLKKVLEEQKMSGGNEKIGDLLIKLGLASSSDIYRAIHTQFRLRKRRRRLENLPAPAGGGRGGGGSSADDGGKESGE